MKFYEKVSMEDLLCQSLYEIMLEKPFEKITIKQICNKTGVNRGTFYNHFIDKYEALEYLTKILLLDENINKDDTKNVIINIINTFYDNKEFFHNAFEVTGQNGFEEMLMNIFYELFSNVYPINDIKLKSTFISKDFYLNFISSAFLFIINTWIKSNYSKSSDELYEVCMYLFNHSYVEILSKTKEI